MTKITILPYMGPTAYHDGTNASDYQMDMLYHGLNKLDDVKVQQFPYPWHMHENADKKEIEKIWGKGFTLYGNLPINSISFDIVESDLIIVPLHHTMTYDDRGYYRFVKSIISSFKRKTICVDGRDFSNYSFDIAELCPYFKRELEDGYQKALPIFFAIPEEKICYDSKSYIMESYKIHDFSKMVPAMHCWNSAWSNDYFKWNSEVDYYEQYQKSWFGINIKKAGWGTGRLQEICANNCLPYWTDLDAMPENTYHNLNRELFREVKRLKGVSINTIQPLEVYDTRNIKYGEAPGSIDWDIFDIEKYGVLVSEMKNHCRKDMTTKALAKYVLEKSC